MTARITTTLENLVLLQAKSRGFSFLPRQPVHSLLSGRHASRLRGRGLSFEELRHYQQGDDIRTIDWKATARLRSPFVRVYNEERERPVLLVVDQRGPMFFGSSRAMKSVTACELAAIAAWRTLFSGDRVGAIVFNEEEMAEIRPQRSQSNVMRILGELVRFNGRLAEHPAPGGATSLDTALGAAARRATHDVLVVLVTDLDGAAGETKHLATEIARHNDMIVIPVYDPLGARITTGPNMAVTDRGRTWNLPSSASFERDFLEVFEATIDEWVSIFRALRVPLLPVSTAADPAEQLRALFGAAAGAAE